MKNVVQDLTSAGLDWAREKWQSGLGSKFIHQGEKNAAKYADEIIVLSKGVQKYFMDTYGRETHFIPNGVNRPEVRKAKLIRDNFGLEKDSYILFLGRLVPEKGIRYLVEAFKNVKTDKKLVIAGGSSDTDSFIIHSSMIRDPNCRNDRWAVAKLDAIIEGEIRKLAFDPAALELAVSGPQQDEDVAQRRAALQQHLEDLRGQMGRVLDLYQMGGALSASMVGDRVAKLQAEIDGVEAALAEAVEEPPTQRLDAARAALVGAEDVLDNGTLDEKRELVHSLIRRIDLDGENIDIHWSFAPEN